MQIALVSRSLAPFGGGGIGQYVDAAARLLSRLGDVTIFTTDVHEPAYSRLRTRGDAGGSLAPGVEYVFVPEPKPENRGGYYSELHRYCASLLDAIAERFPDGGPDLIEAADYLGEGSVLAQARATGDPRLVASLLGIRLHTTAEIAAVLDGHLGDDFATQSTHELERLALRHADTLIWAGGDVLRLYGDFYGRGDLAPGTRIRYPLVLGETSPIPRSPQAPDRAVRFLYLGRLERRKGVQNLLRAVTALERDDWELTLLGGDTRSAPLGTSLRAQLEAMAGGHPAIRFIDHMPSRMLAGVITEHDVVVLPSLWENWPYVALQALAVNRPLLATPTGGFTEIVQEGRNGWLTTDVSADALEDAINRVLDNREALHDLSSSGAPRQTAEELTDDDEILIAYERIVAQAPRPHPPRRNEQDRPLVSVIVPYYRLADQLEETVRSIVAQTYSALEVIIINDGSFDPEDAVVAEVAARYPVSVLTERNSGLGAARNFGISQARGKYVLPVDADNLLATTFVERCVDILEADPDVAFVTTWSRYIDEEGDPLPEPTIGYQPIGNRPPRVLNDNIAGDATAVLRARLFDLGFSYSRDLTSFEDWQFYRELHVAGHFGLVIPQRLLFYRVRAASMLREIGLQKTGRLFGEMQAHLREKAIEWQSKSD